MPHVDIEHGLRVQLATALRERNEARALAEKWILREAACVERGIRADADALSEVQGLQAALANANAETAHLAALRAKQDAELVSTREALAAANARAEKEHETARGWSQKAAELEEALAAARREITNARRVIFMLVTQMGGEVVIGGSVMMRLDDARATIETSRDPSGDLRIRAALAAPPSAAGEEK